MIPHRWITQIESQLRDNDGLRADLDEKSDQLDRAREIDYDIVTRTYEIDKIQEFLETIEEDRLEKVGPNEGERQCRRRSSRASENDLSYIVKG